MLLRLRWYALLVHLPLYDCFRFQGPQMNACASDIIECRFLTRLPVLRTGPLQL